MPVHPARGRRARPDGSAGRAVKAIVVPVLKYGVLDLAKADPAKATTAIEEMVARTTCRHRHRELAGRGGGVRASAICSALSRGVAA